ncbi:arylsulfatase [Mangrovactinospora gilvigrisea]|uniref:Arylsulfatase n=1 Tax=Mangrovactinospora gilvigrisea TaxID=1428644 RepID=A0A1J7C177_9ACTN|nr:sulfatase-like hydrolase/transferase [Mangrovactinospora gilvigrisea]OIV35320.1 arylsulfatase [Mangrovactinospora gilvigrisea]
MPRPNILLISVDQWRGDAFSGAGHPVVMTPYLDQWAATGTRFSRAYSATPTCIPARAALLLGQSQERHGRVGYRDGVPWDYPTTLAGELTAGGYRTQAVGKMHVYPERNPMGFQDVALHDGFLHFARRNHRDLTEVDDYLAWLREETGDPTADYADHGIDCNSVVARPWPREERLHPTNWVVSRSIEFLREHTAGRGEGGGDGGGGEGGEGAEEQPFFLMASFHRPHPPYDPPAWAFEQYVHQPMPEPPVGDWAEEMWGAHASTAADAPVARYDARTLQRARAGYYGHMSHIDQQINRLLEELTSLGLREDTVVCLVADHGELMGDHHLFRKSLPYEGSARIPFLLSTPEQLGGRRGQVRGDAVVELRDVMPTLLECAGLPVPDSVDGRSVLPLHRGEPVPDGWRPWLHGEHTHIGGDVHYLTDGREKYVWRSGDGAEQLFDLAADPTELHDLARAATPANQERVALWRGRTAEALDGRPEGFVKDGALVAGVPVGALIPSVADTC